MRRSCKTKGFDTNCTKIREIRAIRVLVLDLPGEVLMLYYFQAGFHLWSTEALKNLGI
jgi:hypothetical protein